MKSYQRPLINQQGSSRFLFTNVLVKIRIFSASGVLLHMKFDSLKHKYMIQLTNVNQKNKRKKNKQQQFWRMYV